MTGDRQPWVTVFRGRVADHNPRGMRGAGLLGAAVGARCGCPVVTVGVEEAVLDARWEVELAAASTALGELREVTERAFDRAVPVTVLPRCTGALATLPVLAGRHPRACVVWFDAHADLHLPSTTTSGYLGGMALSGPLGWWDSGHGGGLDAGSVVLVGARDVDPAERDLIAGRAVATVPVGDGFAERLRDALDGRPVYVHLDCDVLEPGLVPTDYRVPGGLGLEDLEEACVVLSEVGVVGVEVAEFEDTEPGLPAPGTTGLVSALGPLLDAARHRGAPR